MLGPVTTVTTALFGLLAIGVAPLWPWSKGWSWAPFGMILMGLLTFVIFSLSVVPE